MSDQFIFSTSNFGEPEPVANRQATILGVCIAMMVRVFRGDPASEDAKLTLESSAGFVLDMRDGESIRAGTDRALPRLGRPPRGSLPGEWTLWWCRVPTKHELTLFLS